MVHDTGKSPFVIAEIGINHNGDLAVARALIDMAVDAGCDAVKFQKRTPEICVPEKQKKFLRETPWGLMTYLDYRHKVEFNETEYDIIDKHCKDKEIEWFVSPWDVPSQEFIQKYDLKYNKVASALLTHIPLLEAMAKDGKHTFISTGMSTFDEIDRAVEVFKEHNCQFTLMHGVSIYPCENKFCNVNMINTLRERYKCPVGYSGHEPGILPSVLAVANGAVCVERHVTIARTMFGSDQAASLEKRGLELLVRDIQAVREILGSGEKVILDGEYKAAEKLRYFNTDIQGAVPSIKERVVTP